MLSILSSCYDCCAISHSIKAPLQLVKIVKQEISGLLLYMRRECHIGERQELLLQVWCLAVSPLGDMVVTGSADRSIRIWERTDEPFFAEEERENRLESLFETDQPVSLQL